MEMPFFAISARVLRKASLLLLRRRLLFKNPAKKTATPSAEMGTKRHIRLTPLAFSASISFSPESLPKHYYG